MSRPAIIYTLENGSRSTPINTDACKRLLKYSIKSHLVYALFLATIGTVLAALGICFILFANYSGGIAIGVLLTITGTFSLYGCNVERKVLVQDRNKLASLFQAINNN